MMNVEHKQIHHMEKNGGGKIHSMEDLDDEENGPCWTAFGCQVLSKEDATML